MTTIVYTTGVMVTIYLVGVIISWILLKILSFLIKNDPDWNEAIARIIISLFSWITVVIAILAIVCVSIIGQTSDEPPWWL